MSLASTYRTSMCVLDERGSVEDAICRLSDRSGFFDYVENTLPTDVRLVSVQPRVERGDVIIVMLVVTRQLTHLRTFTDNLAETNAFVGVFITGQQPNDDGTISANIETRYAPPSTAPAESVGNSGGRP